MARQDLTVTSGTSRYPTTGAILTFTAADTTNFERFVLTDRDIVLVWNSGASPYTYTITSTADPQGRTGDITTAAIAAGAIHALGPFALDGWRQSAGGYLHMQASNAAVKWAIYRIP